MENNNYNNNFNGTGTNGANTAAGASDSTAVTGNTDYTSGSQANTDSGSTYRNSYVGPGQQNPNNIWRAEENTANGYTNSSGNHHNSYNNYNSRQANADAGGTYTGTQAGGSAYDNIYGSANTQGRWNTYSEAKQQKKEERARKRAQRAANIHPGFGIKLAKCASIALIFGLVSGTAFEGSSYLLGNALGTNEKEAVVSEKKDVLSTPDETKTKAVATSSLGSTDIADVAEACMPSIVAITNLSQVRYQNFFGQIQNYEIPSAGSGIIISEDDDYLYIVTNNHVVANSQASDAEAKLTIQFIDDSTAEAEIKGTDSGIDLAVVKVKKSDIKQETLDTVKVAVLGDSDEVKVGSQAIAIGNALGYGQSVTTGVVSALEREVTIEDESTGGAFTNNLIQTDAAINPGNSGGALLNSNGEVIGINSSKYSDTDVEGMGFAIPSNTAKPIIEALITKNVVSDDKAAYLGIVGADMTSSVAQIYNMPEGVFVKEVSQGTAAEKYGLKQGDIITAFDGREVKNMTSLQSMLAYYEAGSEVELTIQRTTDGGEYQEQKINVVLGKKES